MQPFDENNIRKAIEKWENEPSPLAFNKKAILGRLSVKTVPLWHYRLMQVAAIVIILLLSGSLGYAIISTRHARLDNNMLLSEQIKQQKELKQLRDSLNTTKSEKEIRYVTVVEEKKIPDPDCNQNQLQMQTQLATLENENMNLKASLQELSTATSDLNDSIQKLLNNMDDMEQEYLTVISKMKTKSTFDINYDQQMLASSKENGSAISLNETEEEKVQLKLGNGPAGTAPIRRTFSFR
nr:hypothetical protein [uncultured Carboxylicivirga sp.]